MYSQSETGFGRVELEMCSEVQRWTATQKLNGMDLLVL
jgi:hypothetical protein